MDEQKQDPTVISRRGFMGGVAAATGLLIVPRHVLGGTGYQAPSDRVNIATIGYRHGMGTSNTNALLKVPNVNMVALCDVDDSAAAQKASAKLHQAIPNAKFYTDYRVMLE